MDLLGCDRSYRGVHAGLFNSRFVADPTSHCCISASRLPAVPARVPWNRQNSWGRCPFVAVGLTSERVGLCGLGDRRDGSSVFTLLGWRPFQRLATSRNRPCAPQQFVPCVSNALLKVGSRESPGTETVSDGEEFAKGQAMQEANVVVSDDARPEDLQFLEDQV